MSNHLINESSPYLLQHAHNPVDWFPWGEEALTKAKTEDKPIFLSIGYAACHWCHVMAHESFEDVETATFMNQHFVNIKVDREERPDLDAIYMQATTAMTGSGGWPMSVFLTPDLQPFYAGTYFPPVARYNMPSFKDVLGGLANAWQNERAEVTKVGGQVTAHLQSALQSRASNFALAPQHLEAITQAVVENYDWGYGGWGPAPKFPQPMTIEFLLRRSKQGDSVPTSMKAALHALQVMARGGMYDVAGGGFSRYSTDNFWRVPHFEKMLYDNAQLVRAYLHAWQLTGEPFYRRIVEETLDFVMRELTHPEGGFYSSLDADSEGVEGKYYVWTLDEIESTLGAESEFFVAAYGVSAKGNWEGKTVLQRALDDATLAARFGLDPAAVPARLTECHRKLLAVREGRIRPGTDDKVLTAWNGLMLAAFAEAARVIARSHEAATKQSPTNEEHSAETTRLLWTEEHRHSNDVYYQMATRNTNFLLRALRPDGKLHRSWRDGNVTQAVFLEDYAALILGLLELYQTDFENRWFSAAVELADEMIQRFSDPAGGFFDTPVDGQSLLVRPKDIQDNATPSGNALACEALLKLAAFTDKGEYRDRAEQSLWLVSDYALKYPTGFARWLSAVDFAHGPVKQVAILGEGEAAEALIQAVRSAYRPNVIVAASPYPPADDSPALLHDRPLVNGRPTAYVCEGFVCRQPVTDVDDLLRQL